MTLRKIVFWAHLATGLAIGLVVLTMAVTGVLFAYQRQIIDLAERGYRNPAPAAELLRPAALLEKLRAALPEARPGDLLLRRDPALPAVISLGRDRTVLVDRSTGALLGDATRLRPLLHDVEQLHRNLLLEERGKVVTGASALGFLALIVSGLYLWFPRRLVKAILRPRFDLRGKARDFNWHNTFGFWAAVPLLVLTLTGVIMSYPWANALLFRATGNEPPPARKAPAKPAVGGGARPQLALDFTHLDALWAAAEAHNPNWQSIRLRAQGGGGPTNLFVEWGLRPNQRATLSADLRAGTIVKTETYESYNAGRQARSWVKPIHTGEAGGILGQTVAALSALAAIILVWTGFALSWRRFFKRSQDNAQLTAEANRAEPALVSSNT